jgi:hypothetical protein
MPTSRRHQPDSQDSPPKTCADTFGGPDHGQREPGEQDVRADAVLEAVKTLSANTRAALASMSGVGAVSDEYRCGTHLNLQDRDASHFAARQYLLARCVSG